MNVRLKLTRLNRHPELFSQMLGETVDEMPRAAVAPMDQRIAALDHFYLCLIISQLCEVGAVLPQMRARRPYIGDELAGMVLVQIPHRRSEHQHITGGL